MRRTSGTRKTRSRRPTARPPRPRHNRVIGRATAGFAPVDTSLVMGTAHGNPLSGEAVPLNVETFGPWELADARQIIRLDRAPLPRSRRHARQLFLVQGVRFLETCFKKPDPLKGERPHECLRQLAGLIPVATHVSRSTIICTCSGTWNTQCPYAELTR